MKDERSIAHCPWARGSRLCFCCRCKRRPRHIHGRGHHGRIHHQLAVRVAVRNGRARALHDGEGIRLRHRGDQGQEVRRLPGSRRDRGMDERRVRRPALRCLRVGVHRLPHVPRAARHGNRLRRRRRVDDSEIHRRQEAQERQARCEAPARGAPVARFFLFHGLGAR